MLVKCHHKIKRFNPLLIKDLIISSEEKFWKIISIKELILIHLRSRLEANMGHNLDKPEKDYNLAPIAEL